jgi:predicted transposase YbfD/YdcC
MTIPISFDAHFDGLDDPRIERTKLHPLRNIVTIALCGVLCGAESWTEIEQFGVAKQRWFGRFLDLTNGIPSHDTFGRVFAALDPAAFEASFLGWVQALVSQTGGAVVAVDGKTLRRSHDRANGAAALQVVSAFAKANHVVLGQVAVEETHQERTAISALLERLVLRGCIVTIDAAGTHPPIARQILAQGGDYVLALKRNQPRLHQEVSELFDEARTHDFAGSTHDHYETLEKGHGRIERRQYWLITDPDSLHWLDPNGRWPELNSVGLVEAERRVGDTVSRQSRTYLTSLSGDAKAFGHAVRGHWAIENEFHWLLDVAFREDESRVRTKHAAHTFAVLRRLALHLLKQDTSIKVGIKAKRLRAGWDEDYLLHILTQ